MIPELAIIKALENEWNPWTTVIVPKPFFIEQMDFDSYAIYDGDPELSARRGTIHIARTALDPSFWQALGKVLGWGTSCWHYNERGLYEVYRHPAVCGLSSARSQWQIQAQRCYDLILTKQPTEPFWQELLATTPNHE